MASINNKHKEHLAVVPRDVVKRNLEGFRLKEIELQVLPFDCLSFSIKPPFEEYGQWLHPLIPKSLDDLKNWFGIPNRVAKTMVKEPRVLCPNGKLWSRTTQITPKALPKKPDWNFDKLEREEQLAVHEMSMNLLYGYVSPESQKTSTIERLVKFMIITALNKEVQIFMAPDLIICPNEVVEIHNVSTLYFNNILIYGNGVLKTKGDTKIHAVQIKHV